MNDIQIYIALSELISIVLIVQIWKNEEYLAFKLLISAITLIPFIGPVLYFFVSDKTPPQEISLQNRGARGEYTHNFISLKPVLDRFKKKDHNDLKKLNNMEITVDWKQIQSEGDFYDIFLPQIQAPEWHGRNLNALIDSLVAGDINLIEPHYTIRNINIASVPEHLSSFQLIILNTFNKGIAENRGIKIVNE
ncbi:barstar family protein [Endozoicomonas sp. SM1973]|uniref:Barstar family protein n=1 Tax=Spartinivicinus marinus TaxID=2994442 RepID=A0A853IJU1_9GAMM|nr:barstar family protein [Spartinivicinus marinus]MCX4030517.1 barstar family protein [Spartinivicinus marinus]NYZ69657.1 barstar family protein [Spartinivicinus marinus]